MQHKKLLILFGVIGLTIAFFVIYLLLLPEKAISPSEQSGSFEQANNEEAQPEPEKPTLHNVQPIIDAWGTEQTGTYSIVVYDLDNQQVIGSHNEDQVYFAASIYKLYVAYEGYLATQRGTYDLTEPYLNGQSRGECLDAMLRSSDSPCAEKLWTELGKEAITSKLRTYGIEHTSMTGVTTTAQDAATLLIRLYERTDLEEAYANRMLDSMKTQDSEYRRGLPSGMPSSIVYNKVGWNELKEWHDTAIVSLPNGRDYVVTLLTENIGTGNIKALAASLESELLSDEE